MGVDFGWAASVDWLALDLSGTVFVGDVPAGRLFVVEAGMGAVVTGRTSGERVTVGAMVGVVAGVVGVVGAGAASVEGGDVVTGGASVVAVVAGGAAIDPDKGTS